MDRDNSGFGEPSTERLINNKRRVRKHGEVFTPSHIVKKMLDVPSISEACEDLTATFFEPGAGEGAFLVEVLKRKLRTVEKHHSDTLERYENYSLLVLSTLYGIELLEDNTKICVMELYRVFYDSYLKQLKKHSRRAKSSVLYSAELIIAANIVQGDFLTKQSPGGTPVVFSEWKILNLEQLPMTLMVQRTEYTLEEIESGVTKEAGTVVNPLEPKGQIALPFLDNDEGPQAAVPRGTELRYLPCKITAVHREELSRVHE
ncbi:MAG TPA: methylase [Firmicutes bacterium]|jgi:hypothetical protein|nr:methylase [Bacillota bacterium]